MSSAPEEVRDNQRERPSLDNTTDKAASSEEDVGGDVPRHGPVPLGGNMRAYREYECAEITDAFNGDDDEKTEELLKEALLDPHLPLYFRSLYESMLVALPGTDSELHVSNTLEVLRIMEEGLDNHPDAKESDYDYIRWTRTIMEGFSADVALENRNGGDEDEGAAKGSGDIPDGEKEDKK